MSNDVYKLLISVDNFFPTKAMIFDILRTVLIMENEDINFAFRTALSHAAVVGAEYYSALETGLDRLDSGRLFHLGELLPSQVALKLLNVHGGLICAPLGIWGQTPETWGKPGDKETWGNLGTDPNLCGDRPPKPPTNN